MNSTMNNTLFLGSSSRSRQQLLTDARIPFKLVFQDADETVCDWNMPLQHVVERIACYKMEHVRMHEGREGEVAYVLTADTLTQDVSGAIHGKPIDTADELLKLRAIRHGATVGTAFCLDKKRVQDGQWIVEHRIIRYASATCVFDVPDYWVERYVAAEQGSGASGGMRIEGFGSLFLQSITGSYTAVVGLPLFELRQALEELHFF